MTIYSGVRHDQVRVPRLGLLAAGAASWYGGGRVTPIDVRGVTKGMDWLIICPCHAVWVASDEQGKPLGRCPACVAEAALAVDRLSKEPKT